VKYEVRLREDDYKLVTGDKDMKWCILVIADLFLTPKLSKSSSVFDIPPIGNCLQPGQEAGQLLLPIV